MAQKANLRNLKYRKMRRIKPMRLDARSTLLLVLATACLFCVVSTAAEPAQLIKNLEAGKKQHLVTYGTSLTHGGAWVGQIKEILAKKYADKITVTNSAQSGMWSKWGLEHLDERVLQKNPDTVIIEWAINDAFLQYKTSVEEARKNLESMMDQILKKNPQCEIILMTMDPPIREHLQRRPDIEKYYQMYRDVAKERKLRLIDHEPNWKAILQKDPKKYDELVPDGIHPNAKGCEQVITPIIEASLFGK
jgi:lysophospholipase L1-like esterase